MFIASFITSIFAFNFTDSVWWEYSVQNIRLPIVAGHITFHRVLTVRFVFVQIIHRRKKR